MTHVGGRSHNEDAFVTGPLLFAVADGMGGHDAGEVAARIVTESLHTITSMPTVERQDVASALRRANDEIYTRGRDRPPDRRLGTTVTGLALTTDADGNETMLVFNVGDSRTYLLRSGVLTQLTRDHSLVQELVDAGQLTPAGARRHRRRNVVTRALGIEAEIEIDFFEYAPVVGDRFLVCSDGLEVLTDAQLGRLLTVADPVGCAQGLVEAAVAAPARDNVTAIVVDIRAGSDGMADAQGEVVTIVQSSAVFPPRSDGPTDVQTDVDYELVLDDARATEVTVEIPLALPVDAQPAVAAGRRRTRKSSP